MTTPNPSPTPPQWAIDAMRALSEYTEHPIGLDNTYAAIIAPFAPTPPDQSLQGGGATPRTELCEQAALGKPDVYRFACMKECARQLETELAAAHKRILDDNKAYGCELRDPSGTIWEHAASLEKQLAAAKQEVEDARETARKEFERAGYYEKQALAARQQGQRNEGEAVKALEKVHALLMAMPDAPTTSTDITYDKWRLWTDAVNVCKSALFAPSRPATGND